MSKKDNKKKGKKGANKAPFFDLSTKGLPKKAVRKKDKTGRIYYISIVNGKKKRISKNVWSDVKKYEKQKPKRKVKSQSIVSLPSELHRAFLSLIKEKIFNQNHTIEVSDINKRYSANGSFEFFNSMRKMYNFLIKTKGETDEPEGGEIYAEESNDLIYKPYIDLTNKIVFFKLSEVMMYNHNAKTKTKLNTEFLKTFF